MPEDRLAPPDHAFAPPDLRAVYRAIFERRDMRHFAAGEALERLVYDNQWGDASVLFAAAAAPAGEDSAP